MNTVSGCLHCAVPNQESGGYKPEEAFNKEEKKPCNAKTRKPRAQRTFFNFGAFRGNACGCLGGVCL